LNDKTSEKYTPPPPPAYVAFSGSGTSLSDPKKPQTKFTKKKGPQENFILEPNRNKPVTTIQVRLASGQRITVEANLDTKVEEIFNHVVTVGGISNF
jgi:UBX domain-containing protein 1